MLPRDVDGRGVRTYVLGTPRPRASRGVGPAPTRRPPARGTHRRRLTLNAARPRRAGTLVPSGRAAMQSGHDRTPRSRDGDPRPRGDASAWVPASLARPSFTRVVTRPCPYAPVSPRGGDQWRVWTRRCRRGDGGRAGTCLVLRDPSPGTPGTPAPTPHRAGRRTLRGRNGAASARPPVPPRGGTRSRSDCARAGNATIRAESHRGCSGPGRQDPAAADIS